METKRCGRCGTVKPLSGFYRNAARHDGVGGYCIPCQRAADNATEQRQRAELLALLGGVCKGCGFDNPLALQVDHVNGGGGAARRAGLWASPRNLLNAVRRQPDEYQLLCANCNIIKRFTLGEHVGARVYERVVVTTRRPPDPGRVIKRYAGADSRALALIVRATEYRATERSPARLPEGSWSRWYLRCIGCGTDDRHHSAGGLCHACYHCIMLYWRRHPEAARP